MGLFACGLLFEFAGVFRFGLTVLLRFVGMSGYRGLFADARVLGIGA